jgi:hypothetical protein
MMTDYILPNAPLCPGCGLEADVKLYYVEKTEERKRIGYDCSCGAYVRYGMLVGSSPLPYYG